MKNIEIVSKVVSREGEAKSSPSKGISSVNLSDYLLKSIWDKVFEIRTDSQGTEYIFGKLPVVTQYGITMYSGDGVDIPSLASGLPFDGRTIWYNPETQQIEVIGGTGGGGLDITALQNYLTSNSYLNVTSGDNRYLKLSGGTISGTSINPLTINTSYGANEIRLAVKNANKASIGWGAVDGVFLQELNSLAYFGIQPNGTLYFNNGNQNTLWHSGNDGSGSGLDADLLDGYHSSYFIGQHYNNGSVNANNALSNHVTHEYRWSNTPISGIASLLDLSYTADWKWQLFACQSNQSLYSRFFINGTTWVDWKQIAFTDSNVASATKLQTARTIWGHNFDGTENVFGQLYLNASKIVWHNDANNYYIGCPTVTGGAILEYNAYSGHAFLGGNVGIGTTDPSCKLHVKLSSGHVVAHFESALAIQCVLSYKKSNGIAWAAGVGVRDGGDNFGFWSTTSQKCVFSIDTSGNVLANGGITMYSMRKLKNVKDERGLSLSELSAIKPTRYTWKDGRDNKLHIGGIADDIEQVLPEVVYKTSDGVLTMDYGNAAFAVASSLIKPVVDHEKRIAMLEEENKQLRQEVERLKSA